MQVYHEEMFLNMELLIPCMVGTITYEYECSHTCVSVYYTTFKCQFSLSTVYIENMYLKLSGLVASTFTHQNILSALWSEISVKYQSLI